MFYKDRDLISSFWTSQLSIISFIDPPEVLKKSSVWRFIPDAASWSNAGMGPRRSQAGIKRVGLNR